MQAMRTRGPCKVSDLLTSGASQDPAPRAKLEAGIMEHTIAARKHAAERRALKRFHLLHSMCFASATVNQCRLWANELFCSK